MGSYECLSLFWLLGITIGVLIIVWLEREIFARIQQYIGPEYASPLGILQALADGTKLLFKKNILSSKRNTHLFSIGPSIAVISILLSFSIIPFSSLLISTNLNIVLVGLLMSRYKSNNKYSFLGGLQMPIQCQKVKEVGDLRTVEPATKAQVNDG